MKVVLIANSDLGKHGNIGFRTFTVAKEAYKRGYLDRIIVRGNKQNIIPKKYIRYLFPGHRVINLMINFLSIYTLPKVEGFFNALNINLFDAFCKRRIKNCSILHIYADCKKTIRRSHKLGNITIYDSQMAHYAEAPSNKARKELVAKEVYDIIKYADYIVCSSDFVTETYLKHKVPREKLISLPFGVDLDKFTNLKKKNEKVFRCLYVGVLSKRKGIEYLLNAWEQLNLNNSELVFCGRWESNIRNLLNKYRNSKTIKFKGFVNPVEEYQKADIFVFPSLFESSAKAQYEAMASGLPIITTTNAGAPFKNKSAGFIVPIRNSNAIAEKIRILYEDKRLRDRMGQKGREIAETLSWENYGKRMNDIYEKIKISGSKAFKRSGSN